MIREKDDLDRKASELISDRYFDAKCGHAGAEYNLEKAGMIAMIFGHVAGQMRHGDNFWDDIRWILTDLGRRARLNELERIILSDPPLEVAVRDAEDEAADIDEGCGGSYVWVVRHKRILTHLEERVERIRATESQGTQ
jgi:hypothetical protein